MFPFNYILLFIFTTAVGYLLVRLVEKLKVRESGDASLIVVQALSMTVGLTIGLATFAIFHQDEFNLTSFTPYLYILGFSTAIMSIVMLAVNSTVEAGDENAKKMTFDIQFIYCLIGVMIFGLFLMYDIQLIVGGQAALYKFDLESYVLGALALYIDVINIFAILLQLFSDG